MNAELKPVEFDFEFSEEGYVKEVEPTEDDTTSEAHHKRSVYITELDREQGTTPLIHRIEDADLPDIYGTEYAEMPSNVDFQRVINNILNAMNLLNPHDYDAHRESFTTAVNPREDSKKHWSRYLLMNENMKVFSDAFWFCLLKFFKQKGKKELKSATVSRNSQVYNQASKEAFSPSPRQQTTTSFKDAALIRNKDMMSQEGFKSRDEKRSPSVQRTSKERHSRRQGDSPKKFTLSASKSKEDTDTSEKYVEERNFLLSRIAKNYVDLFLNVEQDHKPIFFERYFDIISQGVIYSYFYAFPKSRAEFNNEVKKKILLEFSQLFTGVKISNPHKYYSLWSLDLGAGNVFKTEVKLPKITSKDIENFPLLRTQDVQLKKSKRVHVNLQYSQTVDRYLEEQNYKTRGLVKKFWMRFSQAQDNQDEIEQKFAVYQEMVKKIEENTKTIEEANKKANEERERDLIKLKNECYRHQKRLQKRKMEELEKGAHEYANYLVSMLNAANNNNSQGKNLI